MEMEALRQKIEYLEDRTTQLQHECDIETHREMKLAIRNEIVALRNQIKELLKNENFHLEQSRGNFLNYDINSFIY